MIQRYSFEKYKFFDFVLTCRSHFDEPNSFSDESVYSFESLIVPYDMDGDFEDLQGL